MKRLFACCLLLFSSDPRLISAAQQPQPYGPYRTYNVPASVNASTLGFVGDGTTDNRAAFSKVLSNATSPFTAYGATITFNPGIYRISCSTGANFSTNIPISFLGSGQGITTFELDAGCGITQTLFTWADAPGLVLSNFTLDLNTPAIPPSLIAGIALSAAVGNFQGALVDNIGIINGVDRFFELAANAAGGLTFDRLSVRNSYFQMTPGTLQNECIGMSTVNAAGFITNAKIENNTCVGSAMQIDGSSVSVSNNNISGFKFGCGIFTIFNTGGQGPSSTNTVIANNVVHDTVAGLDSNSTAFCGIENDTKGAIIQGNILYNLGGAGIFNYSGDTLITGNITRNNGINGSGGPNGALDTAGISIGYSSAPYLSDNVTISGNVAYDDGTGTQKYGYYEKAAYTGHAYLRGNDFHNNATAQLNIVSANTVSLDYANGFTWNLTAPGATPPNMVLSNTTQPVLSLTSPNPGATTTPTSILLDNTYSSVAGANLKVAIYGPGFGMGVSAASLDIASGGSAAINFYPNGSTTSLAQIGTTGAVLTPAIVAQGGTPVNSGSCAINAQTGGKTAGTFTSNGGCAAGTIILAMPTVPTGYFCDARDFTTPADTLPQTASTTSSVTFTGTLAASDVVRFKCEGY